MPFVALQGRPLQSIMSNCWYDGWLIFFIAYLYEGLS